MKSTLLLALLATLFSIPASAQTEARKLRIIAFGGHPDDCEFQAAGVAAKWAAAGHHVKFVSMTNGDIGHWQVSGPPLVARRTAEVEECAELLGITTQVLDIHDGELMPTLENRKTVVRLIREWKADLVLSHRPVDYHPDHRYAAVLVQDAAFMVTVPFFCPETPHLRRNPVFLYFPDPFVTPQPFKPDIAVAIDDVIDKKLACAAALYSQVVEGGANGSQRRMQRLPEGEAERVEFAKGQHERRNRGRANRFREALIEWYGEEKGRAVQYAEVFEICEYGRRATPEQLKVLFPFFDK